MSKTPSAFSLSRGDLYDYQEHAIQHIKENPACALWVDMGLGKTVSALTALMELRGTFEVYKTLVVAPLRVARKVWTDEIEEWEHLSGITTSRVVGTAEQRLAALDKEAHIYLINRENVKWLVKQYIHEEIDKETKKVLWRKQVKEWPWDTLVIDESSSFKNHSTVRFKYLKLVRRLFHRVIELTGTPIPNGVHDLWAQIYLLDRGYRLGHNITAFRDRWMSYDHYSMRWKSRPHALDEIKTKVQGLVLTLRTEDYLERKEPFHNWVKIELPEEARDTYDEMEREYCLELEDKVITAVNGGVLYNKLRQIAGGAIYAPHPDVVHLHDAKIEAAVELASISTTPVLLVYNYVHERERLSLALNTAKIKHDHLQSDATERAWNRGELPVLLLHPDSGGHGLNLHKSGSQTLVFFSEPWGLEQYQQVMARLTGGHRLKPGTVIHHLLVENTIDETVRAVLETKGATQDDFVNAMKRRIDDVCEKG